MSSKKKITFDEFYQDIYQDRWLALKQSLVKEKTHTHFQTKPNGPIYYLDQASVYCAQALMPRKGDKILDMCSAPGGKALVLLKMMESGDVTLNDRSRDRRARLKKNIAEFFGTKPWINFTSHDATKWGLYEQEAYDKILLDAPCSSEAHVLGDERHLAKWSLKRTQGLAIKQYAMLASALMALKVSGDMIYSTCSISPFENDQVIAKLLKKQSEKVRILPLSFNEGEATEFGHIFLPDQCKMGPLYLCRIQKVS